MKHFYLLLFTFFGFNLIFSQSCPDRGFASGNLIYFIDDDQVFDCNDYPSSITVNGVVYDTKKTCSNELVTYETSNTPIDDNIAFTADFGAPIGSCSFEPDGTLPIEEFILKSSLSIFPNPLRHGNDITVSFASSITAKASIYSITGKKIFQVNIENQDRKAINLTNLVNGVYMLKIEKGDALVTRKIVIMK